MRPTSQQIQHAAYDRWLRRGCSHGLDRDDWHAAEKELSFLLNYRTIAEYPLDSGSRLVLGDTSPRRCRFCQRASGQVAFDPPQPVVPDVVGDSSLFTSEVCNDCQKDWRDPLDTEFRTFWEALRAVASGFDGHDRPQTRPVFSVAVFKSLIAGAILILPEGELPSVLDAVEWVSNPDHESDDQLFAGACCQVYSAPFLKNRSWISLARRVDAEAPLPHLICFLGHGGTIIQVPVPLCLHDEDLDGRSVYQPERALTEGYGPDFQETRGTVLPLVLSRRRSTRAPASLHRFLRITDARNDGPRRDKRTRPTPRRVGCRAQARIITALSLAAVVGVGSWLAFDANRSEAGRIKGVRLLTLERPFPSRGKIPLGPLRRPPCLRGMSHR